MVRRAHFSRLVASVALVFAAGGCERGCLARWLGERGVGQGTAGGPTREEPRALDLGGTDCSDGLLRCVAGRVEASRAAHVPHPCRAVPGEATGGACSCPWDEVTRCASGCAAAGLEVLGPSTDAGAAQLCRPEEPVARPPRLGDAVPTDICADARVSCADGVVLVCAAAGRVVEAVAVCLYGCEPQVAIGAAMDVEGPAPEAAADRDGLASILCRRDHAERR